MNRSLSLLIVALVVALERPAPVLAQAAFSDVPAANRSLYNAVQDLAAKGILRGAPDGTLGGNRAMTRGECFLAFNRIMAWFYGQVVHTPSPYPRAPSSAPLPVAGPFADMPNPDSEVGDAAVFLSHIGVLSGYPDQTLKLRRPMTHDEFAAALQRLLRWMDQELVLLGFAGLEAPPGDRARN